MHYEKPKLHPKPRLYLRYLTILRVTKTIIKMLPHIYDHISVTPFTKKKLAISRIKSYFFNENKCQWKAERKKIS